MLNSGVVQFRGIGGKIMKRYSVIVMAVLLSACQAATGLNTQTQRDFFYSSKELWRVVYVNAEADGEFKYSLDERENSVEAFLAVTGDNGDVLEAACEGQDSEGPGQAIGYILSVFNLSPGSRPYPQGLATIGARVTSSGRVTYSADVEVIDKEGNRTSDTSLISFSSPSRLTSAIRKGDELALSLNSEVMVSFTLAGSSRATDFLGCHIPTSS